MRHDILGMIAHIEAAIDFPEDEVDDILTYDIEKMWLRYATKSQIY